MLVELEVVSKLLEASTLVKMTIKRIKSSKHETANSSLPPSPGL